MNQDLGLLFSTRYLLTRESPNVEGALNLLDARLGPRPGQEENPLAATVSVESEIEVIPTNDFLAMGGEIDPLLDFDGDGDADPDDLKQLFPLAEYNKRQRWIPMALQITAQRRRGPHYGGNGGLPVGLLVHWTAGHPDESMSQRANMAAASPFSYLCITEDGTLGQANPLDQRGKHAGVEKDGFNARADYYLIGCEVSCPGHVTKQSNGRFKTYFSRTFSPDDVRYAKAEDNVKAGYYFKFTDEQEESLFQTCLWLKWNDPHGFHFKNVRGHDETAEGRKVDPGGSLSMTMPAFRARLEKAWQELTTRYNLENA